MSTATTSPGSLPWLKELYARPGHHGLLAAFDLLRKADLARSSVPAHAQDMSESTGDRPGQEAVRFSHSADMAFSSGELVAVTVDPTDPTRHLVTTTDGPLGPTSPLPLALADDLDTPLARAVLDLFHHRRTLLLCQGLLAADLPDTLDGEDPWSRRILALVGIAEGPHPPLTALRLAPIFAVADRSPRALALALRRLLPELLADPALALRCEPIHDHWTALAPDQHSRLGSATARLGDSAALGVGVRLPGTAARLVLGPLPADALELLRPGSPAHAQLWALLADFIPEPLALELVLEVTDTSLPPARLGQRVLGRDLWLTPDPGEARPRRVALALHPITPD